VATLKNSHRTATD